MRGWAGQGNGFGCRGHGAKSLGASGDSVCSDLRSGLDRVSGPLHSRDHFLEGEVDARLRFGAGVSALPVILGRNVHKTQFQRTYTCIVEVAGFDFLSMFQRLLRPFRRGQANPSANGAGDGISRVRMSINSNPTSFTYET